jgi:ribosomal protein S12 methylthiotransferase accessory factor
MTGMIEKVDLEIQVPESFPERYYSALVRSADLCAVKKHLANPPQFDVYTKAVEMEQI